MALMGIECLAQSITTTMATLNDEIYPRNLRPRILIPWPEEICLKLGSDVEFDVIF